MYYDRSMLEAARCLIISQVAHMEHKCQEISNLGAQINILIKNVFSKRNGNNFFFLSRHAASQ